MRDSKGNIRKPLEERESGSGKAQKSPLFY